MTACTVEVKASWEAIEADGSFCYICRSACFLGQYQLVLQVGDEVLKRDETVLCSSCYDAVRASQ